MDIQRQRPCLRADHHGLLYCWGGNFLGQTGIGSTAHPVLVPTLAATGYSFVSVFAGGNHTCGLTAAGTAHCWGYNDGVHNSAAASTRRMK